MSKARIIWIAIASLILATIVPLQTASAVGTITKTVTVMSPDGTTPYVGASVALTTFDDANQRMTNTTPVATDASGQATLVVPTDVTYGHLVIEPPVTDTTTAIYRSPSGGLNRFDQTLSVTLSTANMRVKILSADGTNAPAGSQVVIPTANGNSAFSTIRSGEFGLALYAPTSSVEKVLSIADITNSDANNRDFYLTFTVSGDTTTRTLYSDSARTSEITPVAGVYQLQLKADNVRGVLKTSAGAPLTIPTGVTARIVFSPEASGVVDGANHGPKSEPFAADGTFTGLIPNATAGKYYSQILIGGSLTMPSFSGPAIWVDSTGKYSSSQTGTYVSAASYLMTVTLPSTAPNFVVRVPSTSGAQAPVYIDLIKASGNNQYDWWGPNSTSNGIAAYSLPNGDYMVFFSPFDKSAVMAIDMLKIHVSGQTVTVTDGPGNPVAAEADGTYKVQAVAPNLHLKVVNPLTNLANLSKVRVDLFTVNSGNGNQWISGTETSDGGADLKVADGTFELQVGAPGFATSIYTIAVSGTTISLTSPSGADVSLVNGYFTVQPTSANLFLKIADPSNADNYLSNSWVNIQSSSGAWVANGGNSMQDMGFQLADGSYTIEVNTNQPGLASKRYLLTIAGGVVTELKSVEGAVVLAVNGVYPVTLSSSNLTFNVDDPISNAPLTNAGVELFQLDANRNFFEFVSRSQVVNGQASLNVVDGHYGVQVHPYNSTLLASSRYELTVSSNATVFVLKTWAGATVDVNTTDGSFNIAPSAANLVLKLVNPTTQSPINGSWVNLQTVDGQWLNGSGTNNQGIVGLNVAAGKYVLYANPGNTGVGLAASKYNVLVASDGSTTVTPFGSTTALVPDGNGIFTVQPTSANLNIAIVDPVSPSTILDQGHVAVFKANGESRGEWITGNGGGRIGFYLVDGDYIIEVNPGRSNAAYAAQLFKVHVASGTSTVSTLANLPISATSGTFRLSPATANVLLKIVDPGDPTLLLTQSYVNVFTSGIQQMWVTGTGSNNGQVGLNIADGSYILEVNPGGSRAGLAPKKYAMTIAGGAPTITDTANNAGVTADQTSGIFTVKANSSNLNLKIVSPNSPYGILPRASVNVMRNSDGAWIGGSGSNGGTIGLMVDPGTYTLQVEPQATNGEVLARKSYDLVVTNDGTAAIATLNATGGIFSVPVGKPSITGIVNMPTTGGTSPVPNSWVVPSDALTNQQLWRLGSNSGSTGIFGLALSDGSYNVTAQVPWNSGYNLAKSAPCAVTVSSLVVSTAEGGCVQSDKSVVLNLREPNVAFKVKDAAGNVLPYANVALMYGAWNAWAQASSNGDVSLFVDPEEIASVNGLVGTPTIHLRAFIDPPYGNSDAVRSECTEGDGTTGNLCEKLSPVTVGSSYVSQTIGDVLLSAPNTRIKVKTPTGTAAGAGAWVSLFKEDTTACVWCRTWVGGSQTSVNGVAVFNVTDTTGTFLVEVNAPYNQKDDFAQKSYSAQPYESLDATEGYALGAPNLVVTVKKPNSAAASTWAWVGVESLDNSGNVTGWVGGYGTNEEGLTAVLIPSSGKFRITGNPGFGSTGVRTTCDVETNAGGVVTLAATGCSSGALVGNALALTLSLGTLTGTVEYKVSHGSATTKPLLGAVVYAEPVTSATDMTLRSGVAAEQFTTSDASGNFGLNLGAGYWRIKTFYVNIPGSSPTVIPDNVGLEVVLIGDGGRTTPLPIVLDVQ